MIVNNVASVTNEVKNLQISRQPTPKTMVPTRYPKQRNKKKDIQINSDQTERLLNKLYVNEVTLTGQNPPIKYC